MTNAEIREELGAKLRHIDSMSEGVDEYGLMGRVALLENVVAELTWAIGRLLDSPRTP